MDGPLATAGRRVARAVFQVSFRSALSGALTGAAIILFGLCLEPGKSLAAVTDTQPTDVTPRAFSVVWASDDPVTDATVRVFTDIAGSTEITASLTVQLVAPAQALAAGLVKVDVVGLDPNTTYYYSTVTDGPGGQVVFPSSGDLPAVQTAARVSMTTPAGGHLANVVLRDSLLEPDATTPATAALLLIEAPGLSRHPVSGFVGQGGASAPEVIADLNNLFSIVDAETLALDPGTTLRLTVYRGLACPGLGDHTLTRLRRAPEPASVPAVTEVAAPATCFAPGGISADYDCDGAIGDPDIESFRGQFEQETSTAAPNCAFHPDYDLTADLRAGVGDFNLVLFVYGEQE